MVDDPKVVRNRLVAKLLADKRNIISVKDAKKKKGKPKHYYREPPSDDGTLNGKFTFLVPKHFSLKAMGKSFQQIGKDMEDGKTSGKHWKCVESIKEMYHRLYGENCASLTEDLVRNISIERQLLWDMDT